MTMSEELPQKKYKECKECKQYAFRFYGCDCCKIRKAKEKERKRGYNSNTGDKHTV